jgi:hypothetical protein
MLENKYVNYLLDRIPKSKWNALSNLLARLSLSYIGSPILFTHKNFVLREYRIAEMSKTLREKFLNFCYPAEIHDRADEILIDRQYWEYASTFIVFNVEKEIVGCVQFIPKNGNNKIPVEYAHVVNDLGSNGSDFNVQQHTPNGTFAEIYRCRRSEKLQGMDSVFVISMLFKAIWAKVIQTKTEFSYISYNPEIRDLKNMYIRKLAFENPGISLRFGSADKEWQLLFKNWATHETSFSAISKPHFYLQTWVRQGLKERNLTVLPIISCPATVLTEEDTVLFATVVQAQRQKAAVPEAEKITEEV